MVRRTEAIKPLFVCSDNVIPFSSTAGPLGPVHVTLGVRLLTAVQFRVRVPPANAAGLVLEAVMFKLCSSSVG